MFRRLAIFATTLTVLAAIYVAIAYWGHSEGPRPMEVARQAPLDTPPLDLSVASLALESPNPGYVGPEACAECHQEMYDSVSQTRHFRACRAVSPDEMPPGFGKGKNHFDSSHSDVRFEMHRRGEEFILRTLNTNSQPPQQTESRFDLILGSGGVFDDVFLHWDDAGWMTELPVVWLYPESKWATSHFDPNAEGDHSRPLTTRCLECHNTWIEHVPGTVNRYRRRGAILGITCESCHGPGADHVEHHRSHRSDAQAKFIVQPSELDREQQIAICSQCHTNVMKRRGPAFSHRPDQPLDESFRTLETQYHEDDHVADQTKYMRASLCFQNSHSMTCVTCHDPHQDKNQTHSGSVSCYQCHEASDCDDRPNLPTALQDRCVDCHMPQFIKINVNFRTEDDNFVSPIRRWQHRIGIYPEARKEMLRDWHAEQDDPEARETAEHLTAELVTHYRDEADRCRKQYRFLGAIAALREALRIKEDSDTRAALREAVAVQTDLEAKRARVGRLIAENRGAQAVETLEEILRIKPDDATAHGKLGTEYAKQRLFEKAAEHWRAVAEHDPENAYGLGMLAWMALLENRYDEAADYYAQADEIEPYEFKIQYNWALALLALGQWEEAAERLEKALEIEPQAPDALERVVMVLRRLGRQEEAVKYAQRAAALSGGRDVNILMVLAETCAESGDIDTAIRAAAHAKSIAATSDPALARRVDMYLNRLQSLPDRHDSEHASPD